MTSVFVSADLAGALRLKQLVGPQTVEKLVPGQHPLAAGFAALKKELIGVPLSDQEKQAVGNLKLTAKTVFDCEPHWQPHRGRFVADLRKSKRCVAALFELHVMQFALEGRVSSLEWSRYQEGKPDIRTQEPDMLVECKLIRSGDLSRIVDKLQEAYEQHRGSRIPYVIAVGFEHELDMSQIPQVRKAVEAGRRWFKTHPDVAAGLIFAPAPVSKDPYEILGLRATMIRQGAITEVVNHSSTNPLPRGFTFRR